MLNKIGPTIETCRVPDIISSKTLLMLFTLTLFSSKCGMSYLMESFAKVSSNGTG